jgi:UDP-N-acetylmuramoylalanine--D-glutamate ligase
VLNVSPDHLDRYASVDAYAQVKRTIYLHAERAVFNRDDPLVRAMSADAADPLFFTLGEPAEGEFGVRWAAGEAWLCFGQERVLPETAIRVPGRHNVANVLAALAMGRALGLPMTDMARAARQFPGLPHRTQLVAERDGVRWYNDSKGTNVGACIAALEGLHAPAPEGRTVLIAGGQGKGADFAPLKPVVERTCRAVVLIGEDAPALARALEDDTPLLRADSMEQAVRLARERALLGDRVLLSPACASFDMFDNYEHRGRVFAEAVQRWVT